MRARRAGDLHGEADGRLPGAGEDATAAAVERHGVAFNMGINRREAPNLTMEPERAANVVGAYLNA